MFDSSKPIYLQVYESILQKIETKAYDPNKKLPSENDFAHLYEVNRHTVRKALIKLKEEGYIYTKQGKGNYITNIDVPYCISHKSSFSSRILELGYAPKTKLLSVQVVTPTAQVAQKLGLNTKLKVIELKLLRYANDLPISVSYSYFDAFMYKKILEHMDMEPFSLYKILQKSYPNMEITKIATVFEVVVATEELIEHLNMPPKVSILAATTLSKNQHGEFVEYGTSYFRGDMCKIKVDLI